MSEYYNRSVGQALNDFRRARFKADIEQMLARLVILESELKAREEVKLPEATGRPQDRGAASDTAAASSRAAATSARASSSAAVNSVRNSASASE